MAAKLCHSCKSATAKATLFCRADPGFLCRGCDSKVHAANKPASRHARVGKCQVCQQAPASVTSDYLLSYIDPYLDRYIISPDQKPHQQYSSGTDGIVPVQTKNVQQQPLPPSLVDGVPCYDVDFSVSKPFMYNLYASSLCQSACIVLFRGGWSSAGLQQHG
ncbi:hypothetical protein F0562_012136 [Nyssa sinensis]|uniref:B box-type domain-containing protein n=1 Tax=Nyssa sinensis TaxID=561372 RepID=A0A5J4ZUB1_9ASTE|nr:hypothetical protein F0562_012136 [Nyssa sinensis]